MWKFFLFVGIFIHSNLELVGQGSNTNCNVTGPKNNPVMTFDNKKLVFNGLGGINGFSAANQSVSIPTHLAANGIYDSNGEVVFVLTYEQDNNSTQFSYLVGFNKFGQKFYLYRQSALGYNVQLEPEIFQPMGIANFNIENRLIIFQEPGKCDEYYVIHGSELIPGVGTGNHNILTRFKFSTTDYSLKQMSSAVFNPKFGKSVNLVSELRKDENPGSNSLPNPNYGKLFRNIYSFGQNEVGTGDQRGFISTFRVYAGNSYVDYIVGIETPKVEFVGQPIKPTVNSNPCSGQTPLCPAFEMEDAIQISQTSLSSKFLLVGKRGKIMAGGVAPLDYESPIWLFEEKFENQTLKYYLTSCNNTIDKISGVAIQDADITDAKIDYLFYSQERGTQKDIRIHKDVDLNWFKIGDAAHSALAFDYSDVSLSGLIQNSIQSGHKSALEISFGEKYLIYPIVPSSGNHSLGLMELSSLNQTNNLDQNQTYSVPQITSFYTDFGGQHGTNTQLYRQKYVGTENSMLPGCVPTITFENATTSNSISPLSNAKNWIKAFGQSSIEASRTANFLAGDYVQLLPSFHAEANSSFRAAIQNCPYLSTCCQSAIPIYYPLFSGGRKAVSFGQGLDGKSEHFTIHPNPAKEFFTILFSPSFKPEKVIIRDIRLRELSRRTYDFETPFTIPGLVPGVYVVTVESEGYVETQRVVVD